MFGGTGGGGTFTFGTTTPAQTTGNATQPANTGFSFGNTGGAGGFTFGAQQTPAASTTTAPSLFSTPAAGANTTGGFSFAASAAKPTATLAPATGGFSFGAPAATAQTAAPPGFALGGATLTAAAQQKPTGFSFGAPATSTPVATTMGGTGFKLGASTSAPGIRPTITPTVTPGGSFTFGNAGGVPPQRPTLTVPPVSIPAPTAATLGFNLTVPQQPSTATSTATKHTLAGAPAPGFGPLKLGTAAATSIATVAPSTGFSLVGTTTTTTTTTASTGLTLGAAATSSVAPAGGFSFGAATAKLPTATGAVQPAGTATKLPQMNYRQLEECINKWTVELQEQEKIFLQQATQVNAWDRLLIENGEKITQLNSDVERVKMDQQRLDNELDFIRAQQRELEELLSPLESAVQQLPSISYQQHADLEREHTYQMAENIDAQLKRMVQDLKDIIDHVNSTNSTQDNNDPIHQITKILNAHMDSLQWIDQNSSLLSRRVEDISKQMDLQRKEQERNFRLAYD